MQSQLSEQRMQLQKILKVVVHVIYFNEWKGWHALAWCTCGFRRQLTGVLSPLNHVSPFDWTQPHQQEILSTKPFWLSWSSLELLRGNNFSLCWLFKVYPPGVSVHTDPCTLYYYSPFHNVACLSASQRPCAGSLKTSPWCQWKITENSGRQQDIAGGSDITEDKYLEVMLVTHTFCFSSFASWDHWH